MSVLKDDMMTPDAPERALSENEVCKAVDEWFRQRGFNVSWLQAGRPGIDIEATHPNGQQWMIEAKGGRSSNPRSKAAEHDYGQNGAYIGTSQALWKAIAWACDSRNRDRNIGIAIPASKYFDNHSKPLEAAFKLLGIAIFRVHPDRCVEVFPPEVAELDGEKLPRPDGLLSC